MARIPTVGELEQRLAAARTRKQRLEARQNDPNRSQVGTRGRFPRNLYKYHSVITGRDLAIQAQEKAVNFFGDSALGLTVATADLVRARVGYKPAQVRAILGENTPVREISELSNRPYLRYVKSGNGVSQATFTAPISANTQASLLTAFQGIVNAKSATVGTNGSIIFIPESSYIEGQATVN